MRHVDVVDSDGNDEREERNDVDEEIISLFCLPFL